MSQLKLIKEMSEDIETWRRLFANTQVGIILATAQSKIADEVRAIEAELRKNNDHVQMSLLDMAPVRHSGE